MPYLHRKKSKVDSTLVIHLIIQDESAPMGNIFDKRSQYKRAKLEDAGSNFFFPWVYMPYKYVLAVHNDCICTKPHK